MDLNKTEKKFLREVLLNNIYQSEEVIKNSEKNLMDKNLPNYNLIVYEKIASKNRLIINRCNAILYKIESNKP